MTLATLEPALAERAGSTVSAQPSDLDRGRGPIRVCYLIDDLGTGGTEGQLLSLIRHLDRSLVEPHLCLLRGEGRQSQSLEPDNCPVQRLGVGSLKRPRTVRKLLGFAHFLRRQRIDILQIYFRDSTIFGSLAGRLAAVPRILCTRLNLARAETRSYQWFARLCTRWADGVIANSPMCRDAARELDGASACSVHMIENGVELSRYDDIPPLPAWAAHWRPRRVGLLANLRPVKDPATLIRAARDVITRHPDTSFYLAGDGDMRDELLALIRDLKLEEHVILRGRVTDVPCFLGNIDIGVLCSRSEGSSNAVLEYMAAGRAIVATAVGGTLHAVRNGVNGLLIPPGDPQQLASALNRLIENPQEAADLGGAARDQVRQRHSSALRARRFEKLYVQYCGYGT